MRCLESRAMVWWRLDNKNEDTLRKRIFVDTDDPTRLHISVRYRVFVAIDGIFTNKFSIQKWPKPPYRWPHESGSGNLFLVRIFTGWNAIRAATMKRKKERTSTKAEWSLQSYHISCRCPPPGPAERHSNHRTLRKGGRKGPSAMSECQFLEVSCRSPVGFCILPRWLVLSGVVAISSQL